MVIKGAFTNHPLSENDLHLVYNYTFRIDTLNIKSGDMLILEGYDKPFQVRKVCYKYNDDKYKYAKVSKLNNKIIENLELKNKMESKNNSKNSMFRGILSRYTAQFMPEQEHNVRMSMGGTLCVCTDKDSDEWTAVDTNGDLTSYTGSMTIDMPFIYSIVKANNTIIKGDIIKTGNSFAYVTDVSSDGTLKIQSFRGYTHNKKAIKDAITGQATTKVIINPFNFNKGCGFNPMMLALANGESFDVESLMVLSMTPQGKNLFSNTGGGFNMALLWMLDKKKQNGSNNEMMEMLMMSQMFNNGNNPFSNMFGQNNTTPKPVESSELDKVNAKVNQLASSVQTLINAMSKKEEV